MVKLLAFTLVLVSTIFVVGASDKRWYYCHGDYCDEETEFCSDDFQKCRPCKEVLDDCLTNKLPKNCTRVCIRDKFEKQMNNESERKCDKPKLMLNGYHNSSQKEQYDQGDIITVICDPGYRLASKNTIICKQFGVWSNDLPICEEITCPNPSPIRNGYWLPLRKPKERHVAGDRVEAVCNDGYFTDGAKIWHCSNDGNWLSSESYFPVCFRFGETKAYNGGTIAIIIPCVFVIIIVLVALAFCCYKQKRKKQYEKCEDIEMADSDENTQLSESFERKELLDSKYSFKPNSFRYLNDNQVKKSMSCPDLSQQFISSTQPNTRPEGRTREETLICPVQPESSRGSVIENSHDTYRKTFPKDTLPAVTPSFDLNLRFPEQQATNNEQDLAQKLAITSDDINRDDIA